MAKGYGRTLDFFTLWQLIRHHMVKEEIQRWYLVFDKDKGFTAYYGAPDDEEKFFETHDSAMLATLVDKQDVPGVEDYG